MEIKEHIRKRLTLRLPAELDKLLREEAESEVREVMLKKIESLKRIEILQRHRETLANELIFDYKNEELKKAYSELEQAFINAAVTEAKYLTLLE